MKPENKKFLEDNRTHWITLRDAMYMRGLSGHVRSEMQRIMCEEFRPGYTADLWCPPCVSEMVTTLYREFEKWEAQQVKIIGVAETSIAYIDLDKEEEPEPKIVDPVAETPAAPPIQIKANFPKHQNNRRR